MKKFLILSIALIMVFAVAGCSGEGGASEESNNPAGEGVKTEPGKTGDGKKLPPNMPPTL